MSIFMSLKNFLMSLVKGSSLQDETLKEEGVNQPLADNPSHFNTLVPQDAFFAVDTLDKVDALPRNFRFCSAPYDTYKVLQFYKEPTSLPLRLGMDTLQCSGSAQFNLSSLLTMLRLMGKPLMVVDLRLEPHFFNDGHAISFYRQKGNDFYGKPYSEAWATTEQALLEMLAKETHFSLHITLEKHKKLIQRTSRIVLEKGDLLSEEALLKAKGVQYRRLPVLDGNLPDDRVVDQFVEIIQALPSETHIHFHCRGGKGRTSLFMTLYDMHTNAGHVSFEHIIKRQALINPSDVDEYPALRRTNTLKFLQAFYDYVLDKKGLGHQPWSQWKAAHQAQS